GACRRGDSQEHARTFHGLRPPSQRDRGRPRPARSSGAKRAGLGIMLVQILFYVFGTILVLAALGVIISRNPVYSALSLVLCFVTSAAVWLLIEAEFLAVVLVLVYVGAVMVLFLFVVMMLDINLTELRQGFTRFAWL